MIKPSKCSCLLCLQETDSKNFNKHYNSKQCKLKQKINECLQCKNKCSSKFCSLRCSAFYLNKIKPKGFSLGQPFQIKTSCVFCKSIFRIQDFSKHNCQTKKNFSVKNDPKSQYRSKCSFNFSLNSFPDWFAYSIPLIKEYGWYSPKNRANNLNGCSRDHLYSVSNGYKNNIDPKIISHPANCLILPHRENQKKNSKNSVTLEELMDRIKLFEEKYGVGGEN